MVDSSTAQDASGTVGYCLTCFLCGKPASGGKLHIWSLQSLPFGGGYAGPVDQKLANTLDPCGSRDTMLAVVHVFMIRKLNFLVFLDINGRWLIKIAGF